MMEWTIWAVLLLCQQASQTATSRARNTKGAAGLWYNAAASTFSNGVWFASQLYIVTTLVASKDKPLLFAGTLAFYVLFCVLGSVGMQWWLMRWEKKRGMEHG